MNIAQWGKEVEGICEDLGIEYDPDDKELVKYFYKNESPERAVFLRYNEKRDELNKKEQANKKARKDFFNKYAHSNNQGEDMPGKNIKRKVWNNKVLEIAAEAGMPTPKGPWTKMFLSGMSPGAAFVKASTTVSAVKKKKPLTPKQILMAAKLSKWMLKQQKTWQKWKPEIMKGLKELGIEFLVKYNAPVELAKHDKTGQVMIAISKKMKKKDFRALAKNLPKTWYQDDDQDLVYKRMDNLKTHLWVMDEDGIAYIVFEIPLQGLIEATGFKSLPKIESAIAEEYRELLVGGEIVVDLDNDKIPDTGDILDDESIMVDNVNKKLPAIVKLLKKHKLPVMSVEDSDDQSDAQINLAKIGKKKYSIQIGLEGTVHITIWDGRQVEYLAESKLSEIEKKLIPKLKKLLL